MKTRLTAEESAKLIELGVSPERASARTFDLKDVNNLGKPLERRELSPVFTLADILDILPKGICHEGLWIKLRITTWIDEPWFAGYQNQVGVYVTPNEAPFSAPELIDALYSLLVWCLEKEYVK